MHRQMPASDLEAELPLSHATQLHMPLPARPGAGRHPPPPPPSHTASRTPHAGPPSSDADGELRRAHRGRNASRPLPRPQHLQHFARPASYSSARIEPAWMSMNPAHEATEGLRSLSGMSSARSSSDSSSSSFSVRSEPTANRQQQRDRTRKMEGTLPANDGMEALRQRLHEIRSLAVSTEEKAKQMHVLMMGDYLAHKAGNVSPLSLTGSDTRSLFIDEPAALDVGLAAMPINASNPYNIQPGDLEPSFSPLAVKTTPDHDLDESMEDDSLPDAPALGCMHYLRNVKIQCFDCHRWFPCRHCHDSAHDLPFQHTLRRKMTRNMLCMLCQTPQPASEACANCHEWAAYYYCAECKLWDNDSNKSIYHCDDCGICRLGEGLGKDFVHCKKCNVCISISTSAAHPCVEGATEGDCPLCLEEMFASRAKVVSLPCGHYMHAVCYKDLMGVTYKCPVCSKSAVNMELQWRKLDDEIRLQPMPEEDDEELPSVLPHVEGHVDEDVQDERRGSSAIPAQRRPRTVWVGCNDCGSRSWTAFHWLGLKCRVCDSYNTNQMPPSSSGYNETEAERLIRQQQIHRQHDFTGNAVLRDAGIGAEEASPVDSALDVPSSPGLLSVPASPRSPGSPSSSAGASSPGRYFVKDEEPRRPSFTARFSTPTLPSLSNLPEMPRLPRMPHMPPLPHMQMPQFEFPQLPGGIAMPEFALPNMPALPTMAEFGLPELGLPRFSPYGVFDSLSRSLSPMRYYLQGQDLRDEQMHMRRDANRSPLSIRSDPTGDVLRTKRKRRVPGGLPGGSGEDEVLGDWDEDGGVFDSGDESGQERDGDEEESESESEEEEESEDEDAEMVDEEAEGDDEDEGWDLPGHR